MRFHRNRVPPKERVLFDLFLGPTMPRGNVSEFSVEQLELAWWAYGAEIMGDWRGERPGFRPWAFWAFEVGEEEPETEEERMVRLAELDLLTEEELAELAERRTWTDINDGTEHPDHGASDLYQRVSEALP